MDPSNTTPTEPNAAPNPAPAAPTPEAAAPVAPVNADVANAISNPPVSPVVTPTAPAATAPVNPVAPAPAAAPAAPAAPVNPVATPGMNPAATAAGSMSMNQMFQSQPAANNANVFDETTAIAVPEGPKAPDPVEVELNQPMKAAAPAPGSIGSAVSGPADGNAPQNVAFNDPAAGGENAMTANAPVANKKPSIFDKLIAKTKMNKNTLILLMALGGLVVVALIVILILVATGAL